MMSAPAGDGEAENLARLIEDKTGCNVEHYNDALTGKLTLSIGQSRAIVAALRRAQPPQLTGDVGELSEAERERIRWLKAAQVGSAEITTELLAIIDRLNSRLAALADQRDYYKARDDEGAKIEAELRESAKGQLVVVNIANVRAEAAEARVAELEAEIAKAKTP